tara:strand:- start:162 stop:710 length:549 start_codon:yes stop_codon:yes gene_type:complete
MKIKNSTLFFVLGIIIIVHLCTPYNINEGLTNSNSKYDSKAMTGYFCQPAPIFTSDGKKSDSDEKICVPAWDNLALLQKYPLYPDIKTCKTNCGGHSVVKQEAPKKHKHDDLGIKFVCENEIEDEEDEPHTEPQPLPPHIDPSKHHHHHPHHPHHKHPHDHKIITTFNSFDAQPLSCADPNF